VHAAAGENIKKQSHRVMVMAASESTGGEITPAARPDVDVSPAPDAWVCGAAGCHARDDLVLVVIDDWGQRVVCRREHLPDLLEHVLGGESRAD